MKKVKKYQIKKAQTGLNFNKKPISPDELEQMRQTVLAADAANGNSNAVAKTNTDPSWLSNPMGDTADTTPQNGMTNQQLVGTGVRDFSPAWKGINTLALGTTAIANEFNTIANDKRNRLQMIKAMQPVAYSNPNEDGLN